MTWSESFTVAMGSGVAVPTILGLARLTWSRRRVPTALVRSVRRKSYLGAVLAESTRSDLVGLDVLAPRLAPASENKLLGKIQLAWEQINNRCDVRVLTLDSEECIRGGVEHLRDGIEVRVARREFGTESISYHLFEGVDHQTSTAIVNHHDGNTDRLVRLNGPLPAQVFRNHFDVAWASASPLECVIADRILNNVHGPVDVQTVLRRLDEGRARLNLDARCVGKVLPHLAFRHSGAIILIVGLPGAGKSHVRRLLARRLESLRIRAVR